MDADEPVTTDQDDELDPLLLYVEFAERSLVGKDDKKVWADRSLILAMIMDGGRVLRNFQEIGGNYYLEVMYEGIMFIHVSPYAIVTDVSMIAEHQLASYKVQ